MNNKPIQRIRFHVLFERMMSTIDLTAQHDALHQETARPPALFPIRSHRMNRPGTWLTLLGNSTASTQMPWNQRNTMNAIAPTWSSLRVPGAINDELRDALVRALDLGAHTCRNRYLRAASTSSCLA